MGNRRMLAKDVIRTDEFLDLPFSTQTLYMHLEVEADDDGFINNSNAIKRLIGASDEDMQNLIDTEYIIKFESGIIVIRHWKVNNYVRPDRYHPTTYQSEFSQLTVNENNEYVLTCTYGIPNVSKLEPEVKLSKANLSKFNLSKDNKSKVNLSKDNKSECKKEKTTALSDDDYRQQFENIRDTKNIEI